MNTEVFGLGDEPLIERNCDSDTFGQVIVEAVAKASNAPLEDMPPLFGIIDLDALDQLFTQSRTGVLAFRYCGFVVFVHADDRVSVFDG